jgi:protein TonB
VLDEDLMQTQDAMTHSNAAIGTVTVIGDPEGLIHPDEVAAIAPQVEVIPDFVEQMPAFPGGDAEMMKWLQANIVYPVISQDNGVEGRVIVRFVVSKDGSIRDVEVARSLDPSCDREAVRVVKKMPNWIVGRQNGNPVAVRYTLPILFRLQH